MVGKDDEVVNNFNNTLRPQLSSELPPSTHMPIIIAKGDSRASKNYIRPQDAKVLNNIRPYKGTMVMLPDNTSIAPSHKGDLPFSHILSDEAKTATVLPHFKNASLISLGQLCDDGCLINLDVNKLVVTKNNVVVLQGYRNKEDGLWDIPITKIDRHITLPQANYAGLYGTNTTEQHDKN